MKPYGGMSNMDDAWLSPQPGGSADWTWGYYPAGVEGVGPPGIMFVLSTKKSWNFAWYMLNQLTLDRGPAILYPSDECKVTNNNCWSAGNAGEIDFLGLFLFLILISIYILLHIYSSFSIATSLFTSRIFTIKNYKIMIKKNNYNSIPKSKHKTKKNMQNKNNKNKNRISMDS